MRKQFSLEGGGMLSLWEEGERVFFRVEGPECVGYVYKVWLTGERGDEMLLGTPGQEHKMLRLFRTISRSQLEYAGCWPVCGVRMQKIPKRSREEGQWYCEEHPERLIPYLFKNKKRGDRGMLCRKRQDEIQLACPFFHERPVLLSELFCFAQVKNINGMRYLVWCFDGDGNPKIRTEAK